MLRSGAAGAPLQSEYGTEDVEEVDGLAADGAVRGVSGGVFVGDSLPHAYRAYARQPPRQRGLHIR